MKKLKWIVSAALILVFSLCFMFISGGASAEYALGDTLPDFTFTTYDGRTLNLYDTLEEKDMVVINIWATWCGPCKMEFPYMEEAYQLYKDDIEIFALSCESTDTDAILAEFAASVGITFPMGNDNATGLANSFGVVSIPTTIVVDRNGTICFMHSGAITETAMFTRLFDAFIGDDYSKSVILTAIPEAKPDIPQSESSEIAAALNDNGSDIEFSNPDSEYIWPMIVSEKDGRTVVVSTNTGIKNSSSAVSAAFEANAGDVIVVTFKTSTEAAFNTLAFTLDGETKKVFGGEQGWSTYALPIEHDGEHKLELSYIRTVDSAANEDTVWIDSIVILSGEEAASALASNPVYPVSNTTRIEAVNTGARRVYIDDPDDILYSHFGDCEYYVLNSTEGEFSIRLSAELDPETIVAFSNYDGSIWAIADHQNGDSYIITAASDSINTTGYTYTTLYLFSLPADSPLSVSATFFADEENLSNFAAGVSGNANGWHYAEESEPAEPAAKDFGSAEDGMSAYVLTFTDQNGNPVNGVIAQVCNDTTCMVYTSDENGTCSFELPPYEYEVHILKLPDGYSGDTETIFTAPYNGGDMAFTLTKN